MAKINVKVSIMAAAVIREAWAAVIENHAIDDSSPSRYFSSWDSGPFSGWRWDDLALLDALVEYEAHEMGWDGKEWRWMT